MAKEKLLKVSNIQLYKFVFSRLTNSLGSSIYTFGISFFILSKTGSAKLFALNMAIMMISKMLFLPFAGYIADTFDKKIIIISIQVIQTFLITVFLCIAIFNELNIIHIFFTTATLNSLSAISSPALTSSIPNIVHYNHLQKANSYNSAALSLSTLIGPVVGGFLYGIISINFFIIVLTFLYIISTFIDLTINFSLFKNSTNIKVSNVFQSLKESFQFIYTESVILKLIILISMVNFFFGSMLIGISKIVIDELNYSSFSMGLLETSFGIGLFLSSIAIANLPKFKKPFLVIKKSLIVYSSIYILIGLSLLILKDSSLLYILFLIYSIIMGVTLQFINNPIFVYLQEIIQDHIRGRIFSVIELLAQLFIPLSYLIFGLIFDVGYYAITYIISGIICIILILLILTSKNSFFKI